MLALHQVQVRRLLREARGYLELEMPQHALEALNRIERPGTFLGQLLYLRGEALRFLERYAEAIEPLNLAAEHNPSNLDIYLALGWCLKRLDRLPQAIEALERAAKFEPHKAIVQYNLACYWSLARQKEPALAHLKRALKIDDRYRDSIGDESDFDPLRDDPDFQALVGKCKV